MTRTTYSSISALCSVALACALFLQHVGLDGVRYPPCPLCIFQRIGFLGVALLCGAACSLPSFRKIWHFFAWLFAVAGLATSLRHQWVLHYPDTSCGIDPLELFINQFAVVRHFPGFFKADGFCSVPLPPLMGLSVPLWSLILLSSCFVILSIGFFKRP